MRDFRNAGNLLFPSLNDRNKDEAQRKVSAEVTALFATINHGGDCYILNPDLQVTYKFHLLAGSHKADQGRGPSHPKSSVCANSYDIREILLPPRY